MYDLISQNFFICLFFSKMLIKSWGDISVIDMLKNEKLYQAVKVFNPCGGKGESDSSQNPEVQWPASLGEAASYRFSEGPCLERKKNGRKERRKEGREAGGKEGRRYPNLILAFTCSTTDAYINMDSKRSSGKIPVTYLPLKKYLKNGCYFTEWLDRPKFFFLLF